MAVVNAYFYLLTRNEATLIYGESAAAFRYSSNHETFVSKTACDRKIAKTGGSLPYIVEGKHWYTPEERMLIMEGPEWQTETEL